MKNRTKRRLKKAAIITFIVLAVIAVFLPTIGAGLILHPPHRRVKASPPEAFTAVTYQSDGVTLQGWHGVATGKHRGTVIYLHGMADNRVGGVGALENFRARGFDVIAYDSRAHGESGGEACTYGYFEKNDLHRVIDTLRPGPVILIGSSLGGAVALQAAATDSRVSAVVAAEAFSDLRTIVIERAPFFFSASNIEKSFEKAEREAHIRIDEISPAEAAQEITVPVLIIHGADDTDTPPAHSQRIFDSLTGSKRFILVPAAGHNESLQGESWSEIESWVNEVIDAAGERRK